MFVSHLYKSCSMRFRLEVTNTIQLVFLAEVYPTCVLCVFLMFLICCLVTWCHTTHQDLQYMQGCVLYVQGRSLPRGTHVRAMIAYRVDQLWSEAKEVCWGFDLALAPPPRDIELPTPLRLYLYFILGYFDLSCLHRSLWPVSSYQSCNLIGQNCLIMVCVRVVWRCVSES